MSAPGPPGPNTLTVLGCDGGYPGPGGAGSGYLVECGPTSLWLDAGPGTFANLQQVRDPGTVDAVVLSHEHPDHWSDLESFAVWLMQVGGGRTVPVHAPPGLRARSYFADSPVFDWHETTVGRTLTVGSLGCRFVRTDHGPPTFGLRLDPLAPLDSGPAPAPDLSRSLAFSADSGPGWSVDELGSGIGTFLCEATYLADQEGTNHHLSGRQAGSMAAEAGVVRLVLTHRSPTVSADALAAEADVAFGRPVLQASTGRVFEW